jgi:mannose/fructose/N-acetylgalactosamine-specific phosphotransferase system component IID
MDVLTQDLHRPIIQWILHLLVTMVFMNTELSTVAYLKAAEHAGAASNGMNEILVPAIIIGVIALCVIVVSMIVYDTIFEHKSNEEDTYNNRL